MLYTAGNRLYYETGRDYMYTYEVESSTQIEGTSSKRSSLLYSADVTLHVITACEMMISVS